jgi:diketogulonate reductase-like aldo/keto reductase
MKLSSSSDTFQLSDGNKIPCIGFGTFGLDNNKQGQDIIKTAISLGYRHFDTASLYGSEEILGKAVKDSGVSREDFFLTSKVWKDDMAPGDIRKSFDRTLHALGTDYLDLLLIHWPRANGADEAWEEHLFLAWNTFIFLKQEGKVKSIGVSNFLPQHFDVIHSCSEKPVVNQIEFHPGYMQTGTVDYCQRHSIVVEAWSPLGRGALLNNPVVEEIALKHKVSTAKVLLSFCLAHNVLPLVKSSSKERLKDNLSLFDFKLTEQDLYALRGIAEKTGWSGFHPDLSIPGSKVGDF